MRREKRYRFSSASGRIVLLFISFFLAPDLPAQDNIGDTVALDSSTQNIQIETAKSDTESSPENNKLQYFLDLREFNNSAESLQKRQVPDSVVQALQKKDDFWYANAEIKKKRLATNYVPVARRAWFKTLVWLIIIGSFAGFIIWWLAGSQVGLFRKKPEPTNEPAEEEGIPEDIFAISYTKEIYKAVQKGNYRLAVRLRFLELLKDMSCKNIISYKQDRTNYDYLLQVQPTQYYNDFFRITRHYEYSWYGKFDVSPESYAVIKNDFENIFRQMRY